MDIMIYVPDFLPEDRIIWTELETLLGADDGLREEFEQNPHAMRTLESGAVYMTGGGASPVCFLRRVAR